TVITPIFYRRRLMFFAINTAHHVDVGGRVPGSTSPDCRSIYEEGIRIPMVRLVHQGELDQDILDMVAMNCRDPRERMADIRGQLAANEITEKPIVDLCRKYGADYVNAAVEEAFAYTERKVRSKLKSFPDGQYEFTNYLDNDGVSDTRVPIKV